VWGPDSASLQQSLLALPPHAMEILQASNKPKVRPSRCPRVLGLWYGFKGDREAVWGPDGASSSPTAAGTEAAPLCNGATAGFGQAEGEHRPLYQQPNLCCYTLLLLHTAAILRLYVHMDISCQATTFFSGAISHNCRNLWPQAQ
jgi:hypothetical protein